MVVVGILSGKGGVGKTTVTSNLAAALTKVFGRRVIVLDTNITSSHIRLHFGIYDELKKTLKDVIKDDSVVKEAVVSSDFVGVDIIPAPETLKGLDLEKLSNLASKLAESEYDFVVIDSAPGFRENTENVIRASDIVLLITTPQIPDVTDTLKIMALVKKYRKKYIVVLNRVKNKKYELKKEKIMDMLDIDEDKLLVIPEDENVPESISKGVPVVVYKEGSKASIAFKKLAGYLVGEEYKPSIKERIKWFLGL